MLDIFELDDEQLKEYTMSLSDEASQNYALDEAVEKLDAIKKAYNKKESSFEQIRTLVLNKQFDEAYDKCAELGVMLDRLSTRVKMFPFEIGEKSSNKKVRLGTSGVTKKVIFESEDDYLRIVLPELLPHKQQYDNIKKKMVFYYDIDSWKAGYYEQFSKEFENGKYRMFTEKVSICYVMHASESIKSSLSDTDNYDTKVMTDIITTFLLFDDNYLCCNYFVDIIIDKNCKTAEDCFTDIFICPSDRREDILKSYISA